MASYWPAIVSVKDERTGEYSLKLKPAGDNGVIEIPSPYDGCPDLRPSRLFAGYSGIEIDGLSSGNAYLAESIVNGVPFTAGRWLAASMTISRTSPATGSTLFDWPNQGTTNPGGSIVTYYFAQGAHLSNKYRGYTMLETSTEQMGLLPQGTEDIVAIDYGLGVHQVGGGSSTSLLFPLEGRVYFSVTNGWATDEGVLSVQPVFPGNEAVSRWDGAAIYYMQWVQGSGGSGGSWAGPFVYATREDLKLESFPEADVDALDVDEVRENLVFSVSKKTTDVLSTQKQLMIADYDGKDDLDGTLDSHGVVPTEFMATEANGTNPAPVTARTGVNAGSSGDEVGGVCTFDPEAGYAPTWVVMPRLPYNGTASGPTPSIPFTFGMSMVRSLGPTWLYDVGEFQFTGWGGATPQNCTLVLEARVADADDSSAAWFTAGAVGRPSGDNVSYIQFDYIPNWQRFGSWGSDKQNMSFRARLQNSTGGTIATTLIHEMRAY
jgi:hypothetical protein